jgi:hypothetical protein
VPQELLELLRFGTAILAGGLVAVIAQRLAFRHARQLQADEHAREALQLRKALTAELRENVRRLGGDSVTQVPSASVVRSAWDAGRALPLPDQVFDAIAVAYLYGAELQQSVAFVMGRIRTRGVVWTWSTEARARKQLLADALTQTKAAHTAFVNALKLLEDS